MGLAKDFGQRKLEFDKQKIPYIGYLSTKNQHFPWYLFAWEGAGIFCVRASLREISMCALWALWLKK